MNSATDSQKRKALAEISQTWSDVGSNDNNSDKSLLLKTNPIGNINNVKNSSKNISAPDKNLLTRKQRRRYRLSELHENLPLENLTPVIAEIAALDYKFNGARARVLDGEFVGPRWVIDLEVQECESCRAEFNWVNRRHHCRHCGKIFCNMCSSYRSLLPREFGQRDPQRVCSDCFDELASLQRGLTIDIGNHQRDNSVHIASDTCSIRRYTNLPFSYTLGSELRKATYSTYNLFHSNWMHDEGLVVPLLARAKGIAYLTVAKGGFILAPRVGTGLVIARLGDGRWSAPTAIGTMGLCWGALFGADLTDYVIILNTFEAVQAFSGIGQVSIGVEFDVAIGSVGRNGSAALSVGDGGMASAVSYSHSRGLFAGVSLDGNVMFTRPDVNHRFYGQRLNPHDILGGQIPPPRAAQPLYDALFEAVSSQPFPRRKPVSAQYSDSDSRSKSI